MSKTSSLVPLIILLVFLIGAAVVGFFIYSVVTAVQEETHKKMQKRNIHVSRDGMKVGVKEIDSESYTDRTQSVLMQVWNHASWPAYKSRLGWGQNKDGGKSSSSRGRSPNSSLSSSQQSAGGEQRKPYSRHSSNQ